MYMLFLRFCKLIGVIIIHLCFPCCQSYCNQQGPFAPRSLLRLIALMDPSDSLSPATDFPVIPVIRLPCSADFSTGRGGSLLLLGMSLPSCCRYNPARMKPPHRSGCNGPCCLRPASESSASGDAFSRPFMRSLSLRPNGSLTILKDGFVNKLQSFGFPTLCYPSYEAPDYYLGGSSPTEHASLSLDMRRVEDWRHTARCGLSVDSPFPLGVPH